MSKFNSKKNVENFGRALGNGADAAIYFAQAVNHTVSCGDSTQIALLFSKAKSKNDNLAMRTIELTVQTLWIGANVENPKDPNEAIKVKISGCELNQDALDEMHRLIECGCSFRGTPWKKYFAPAKDPNKNVDAAKEFSKLMKKVEEGLITREDLAVEIVKNFPELAFVSNMKKAA